MINESQEKDLICRSQQGDKQAFEQLVELHQQFIYTTAFYIVKNSDIAFDISQNTFLKAYRSISYFRFECKFSTWLYRICQNCGKDFFRREKRHGNCLSLSEYNQEEDYEGEHDMPDESISSSPEELLAQKETVRAVRLAIADLPKEFREIILLRDIEGYSYEAISEALNMEIGTVKSRLFRARQKLKALLEGSEKQPLL